MKSMKTFHLSHQFPLLGYERIAEAIENISRTTGKPPMQLSLCQWGRVSIFDHASYVLATDELFCGIGPTLVVGKEIWSELEGACNIYMTLGTLTE